MIYDNVRNIHLYRDLGDGFKKAYDYFKGKDLTQLEIGKRYEIDGERLHFSIQRVNCLLPDNNSYEAHGKYADIQVILGGIEYMGYNDTQKLTMLMPYDEKKDVAWYGGEGYMFKFEKGDFAIFFPHDAHMPCRYVGDPCSSLKLVVKVML